MSPDALSRISHDPGAFEAFYRAHVEAVQRFVARRIDDPYLAGERAVLELVALDELSVTQAAAVLGLRPVTARVRLHRARGALRRQLFDVLVALEGARRDA
jgi:DNA-directed RNA polymerase specialized sigma24 family protein